MKIRAYITHKKAEHFKDCQDRFSVDCGTKSVAVSDGMSQSYQQKIWAELLVSSFTSNIEWVPNHASVKELSPLWLDGVRRFIQKLKDTNAPQYLVIMNENALAQRKSAGATFCGIRFKGNDWSGDVLGDSCLIELKKGRIQNIYTSQQGGEFDNHPDYFDSNSLSEGKGTPLEIRGTLDKQSVVLLVSDPLSDFLNEKMKLGMEETYVKELLCLNSHSEFEALVENWRDNLNMHNDDTTLVIIEDDGESEFNLESCDNLSSLIAAEENHINEQNEKLEQEEQNVDDSLENIAEDVEPATTESHLENIDYADYNVSVEDFVQTGMEQYEEIRSHQENGIFSSHKDDEEILQDTLRVLYELYSDKFNA